MFFENIVENGAVYFQYYLELFNSFSVGNEYSFFENSVDPDHSASEGEH